MVELGRFTIEINAVQEDNNLISITRLRDIIKDNLGTDIGIEDIISISETNTKIIVYFKMSV